ncbi:uncharacterized protein LOC114828468 [Galendromus occidentalis]|uniref:Uncharacterized protein LOC114828468 n=1 Tax=Galendromus occidentalis TaxID=34638 RepID=A0AAJ7SH57_9ACAR|nr:uncharacterized protein LOC114828468 [Galendromus occidentalis]
MFPVVQLVACALTFSEVFGAAYFYGPHQNPVAIYSPYDYYYIRNLHRIQWAAPADAPPVLTAPYVPATVEKSQIVPSRAPVAAAPISAAPIAAAPTPAPVAAQEGYSFSYEIEAPDGRQSRQESADGAGNVQGSYSFSLNDGRQRTVNYSAGADGFNAIVDTNEPGTEQKNPANVIIANSAPMPQGPAKLPTPKGEYISSTEMVSSSLVPLRHVPDVLEDLTSFILLHVETEGLFRIGGSTERIRVLQERLSKGERIPQDQPIQDVCTILKRWLRKQSIFEKCCRPVHPPESMEDLQLTLSSMPAHNVFTLQHLCKFLQIVAAHSDVNLMDIDNLASILGESAFSTDCKIKEVISAEQLRAQTEVAKQSMKLLVKNADLIQAFALDSCRTPDRPRERELKKSFTTRMKQYGSTLKNLTLKRSRSLSLEPKPEFVPFPLILQSEERIRLRERRGTMTQDTNELMERRNKALQRKNDQVGQIQMNNKENTPVRGRVLRDITLEEPQQLEWKLLPRAGSDASPNRSLRYRVNC